MMSFADIRAALDASVPGLRGDVDGNPGSAPRAASLRAAAVLVPLVARPQGLSVLLTQRTAHLHDHAGQISFPGGRIEADDADAIQAALRETEEEIGLARAHVEIVGRLDTYRTRTAYEVVPVVGLVTPPFDLLPDTFEVADIFEVPLAFVLDPANRVRRSRLVEGRERFFWAIPYGARNIWGATAGMLVNLAEILALEARPP